MFIGYGGKRGWKIGLKFRDELETRGLIAFIAPNGIPLGTPRSKAFLRQKVKDSDAYVLLCNKDACCSPAVLEELGWAANKIMPFKLDNQPVHPMLGDDPQHETFNTKKPDYARYAKKIREGIKEYRRKIRQAKQSLPASVVVGIPP